MAGTAGSGAAGRALLLTNRARGQSGKHVRKEALLSGIAGVACLIEFEEVTGASCIFAKGIGEAASGALCRAIVDQSCSVYGFRVYKLKN